jgi:hypothetical protein
MHGEAGKGDAYRPVDRAKWDEGYDRIYKERRLLREHQIVALEQEGRIAICRCGRRIGPKHNGPSGALDIQFLNHLDEVR